MSFQKTFFATAIAAALFVACSKEEPAPTPAATPGAATRPSAVGSATQPFSEPVKSAAVAAAAAAAEGDKLLNQVTAFLAAHDFTQAEATLKTLDGMRANLPGQTQSRLDEIHKQFDTAKAAMNAMPKMPGM